jgi:HK97 family phage prohead protease
MEQRSVQLEVRAISADHPRRLKGVAVVYNAEADFGDFVERIKPGALARSLGEKRDIKARFEHSNLLASRSNDTLKLTDQSDGLHVEIDVAETRAGDDALALVKRKDIQGMSFGFVVREQRFNRENGKLYRDISDLDLYEVTITERPAYGDTSIATRSVDPAAIAQAKQLLAGSPSLAERKMQLRKLQAAA